MFGFNFGDFEGLLLDEMKSTKKEEKDFINPDLLAELGKMKNKEMDLNELDKPISKLIDLEEQ